LHGSTDRRFAADNEHINRQTGEIARKAGKTIQASFGAAPFDLKVLSLDIAEVTEPKQQLTAQIGRYGICQPARLEIT
jgi:hypothetical protein